MGQKIQSCFILVLSISYCVSGKVTRTTPAVFTVEPTPTPDPSFECPSLEDSYHHHPERCDWFYHCTNGLAWLLTCPDNLYFDMSTLQCWWPAEVDCGDRSTPIPPSTTLSPTSTTAWPTTTRTTTPTSTHQTSTTRPPTTPGPSTPTPTPTEQTTTTRPPTTPEVSTTTRPSTTTSPSTTRDPNEFQCPPGQPTGNFPDPLDCSAFYSCADGEVVGHHYCPDILLWNDRIKNCDYPWNVVCNIPSTTRKNILY